MNQFIGIDIGGTSIKLAMVTASGKMIEKWSIPTNCADHGSQISTEIVQSIEERVTQRNERIEDFAGVGIGVPGPVSEKIVKRAVNLGWENEPLGEAIEQALGLPVVLLNDANAAALGELWAGSDTATNNVVFVTLGTGVGGGIVVNGQIVNGHNASGGEIGHIPVISNQTRTCGCGNTNCLETYASANGLYQTMTELVQEAGADLEFADTKDIFTLKKAGNQLAEQAIDTTVSYLAHALAGIMNTLDPQEVIIGGGLAEAGDDLLNPLQEKLEAVLFPQIRDNYRLRKAVVGNDAGILGAVYQMMQETKESVAV